MERMFDYYHRLGGKRPFEVVAKSMPSWVPRDSEREKLAHGWIDAQLKQDNCNLETQWGVARTKLRHPSCLRTTKQVLQELWNTDRWKMVACTHRGRRINRK